MRYHCRNPFNALKTDWSLQIATSDTNNYNPNGEWRMGNIYTFWIINKLESTNLIICQMQDRTLFLVILLPIRLNSLFLFCFHFMFTNFKHYWCLFFPCKFQHFNMRLRLFDSMELINIVLLPKKKRVTHKIHFDWFIQEMLR